MELRRLCGLCEQGPELAERGPSDGRHKSYEEIIDVARQRGTHAENLLDHNHSHFMLVDDGRNGSQAFGCDRALRAAFETCVADTHAEAYPIYKIALGLKWEEVDKAGPGEIQHGKLAEALRDRLSKHPKRPLVFNSREFEEFRKH